MARILRNLSSLVGAQAEALAALVARHGAPRPRPRLRQPLARLAGRRRHGSSHDVVLREARHPLLDQKPAVPIDLELDELRALVISGPNTGGKTVALKTLGLAAVLHQCGLRPPALEAALPIFDAILVDIGDEQSIAMSLSTFSAHVRNLVGDPRVRDRARRSSCSTRSPPAPIRSRAPPSPRRSSMRLAAQARLTVTTSHYAELKEWASATDGAANAATGIDPESHEPLYTVALGRPGTSHALQTAERLGLDGAIVEAARSKVAPERLQVAELVAEAETAAREAQEERSAAARSERRQSRRASRRNAPPKGLQDEIEQVRASAAAERQRALAQAEAELTARSGRARGAARGDSRGAQARARAGPRNDAGCTEEGGRARPQARRGDRPRRAARRARSSQLDEPLALTAPLAAGDPVVAPTIGVRGTIAEIAGDEATVLGRGGLRVRVPLERLRPSREPAGPRAADAGRDGARDGAERRPRRARPARPHRAGGREAVRDLVDARRARRAAPRCAWSTAAAPERCARPCATSSPGTRSSRGRCRDEQPRHQRLVPG